MKRISTNKIIIDPRVQPRSELIQRAIDDYSIAMREGSEFPPIVVFKRSDDSFLLVHGFHRYRAALKAGLEEIAAEVLEGDIHDAILYAVGANREQDKVGVRWSNADKRRAVGMLLADDKWAYRSDRWIAQKVGVSPSTVGLMRPELSKLDSSTRVGIDGKARPAHKPRSGKEGDGEEKNKQTGERKQDQEIPGKDQEESKSRNNEPQECGRSSNSCSPPRPCGHVGGSNNQNGGEAGNTKNGDRRTNQMDWGDESIRIKGKIGNLVKKFDQLEDELDSLLAEIRDFISESKLKEEGEKIGKETLRIVEVADRIRQKFMD